MTGGPAGEPPRDGSPDDDIDLAADVIAAAGHGDASATPPDGIPTAPHHPLDPAGDPAGDPAVDAPLDDVIVGDGADGFEPAPDEPALPRDTTAAPPPTAATPLRAAPANPVGSAYRSTDERNRSVYRRANPWYRRLARGVIAMTLIGALGVGVYVGAREVRDYLARDQLPAEGAEGPPIRQTSVLVTSTTPQLSVAGTITFDVQTGAFEFVGTPGGPDTGVRLTSPEPGIVYRQDGANWRPVDDGDARVAAITEAISVLRDDTTADAILVNRLRRGYVDLLRQVDEGLGDDQLTRYEVAMQLTQFADAFPLQWNQYRQEALPGVQESRRHVVSIWVDAEDALVRVEDPTTGWNWQRLAYSDDAFEPFEPAPADVLEPTATITVAGVFCSIDQLGIGWTTQLGDCSEAVALGREFAVTAGLADSSDSPAAELAFAATCVALQDGQTEVDDEPTLALAELLDAADVCPGDIERLRASVAANADTGDG